MDHLVFEVGTALVLVAIASVIANKIKFSIIPFLIVLGMLVGPHAPKAGIIDLTFIESSEIIEFFRANGRTVPPLLSRTRILRREVDQIRKINRGRRNDLYLD